MQEEERGGFLIERTDALQDYDAGRDRGSGSSRAEKVIEDKKQEELGLDGWFVFHRKTYGELQGWFTNVHEPADVSPSVRRPRSSRNALPR